VRIDERARQPRWSPLDIIAIHGHIAVGRNRHVRFKGHGADVTGPL